MTIPQPRSPTDDMRGRAGRVTCSALLPLLALAACRSPASAPVEEITPQVVDERTGWVRSNVVRRDYAGSRRCAPCHREIYDSWLRSPMRNMTRSADTARISAPFDGRSFAFRGETARLLTRGGRRLVEVVHRDTTRATYRVTKVIGGRYREDFVGAVASPKTERSRDAEQVLPVSWVRFERKLRYKGYSVMVRERPGLRAGPTWRRTCIFCHNTPPYLLTVLDDLLGSEAVGYQGSVTDRLLPPKRRWNVRVRDERALREELGRELRRLHGRKFAVFGAPLTRLLRFASASARDRFDASQLIELGVGCEACHNGSREHVERPSRRPSFAPRSRLIAAVAPSVHPRPTRAAWINRTCLRCHTVLFSGYPYTWEGARRERGVGGSNINSGEARDFHLGGCSGAMACTTCHDPHRADDPARLRRLQTVAGNRVCLRCHTSLRSGDALHRHSHHRPAGPGSVCVACHMPKKNMGLAYRLTRYHRIASPTDRVKVESDRPLECAVCHGQRSVRGLVEVMERWWNKRYDRAALRRLYGPDLDVNVLWATLARGKAHERAAAIGLVADQRERLDRRRALAALLAQLENPYPLIRFYAVAALQRVAGRSLELDRHAPGAQLRARAAAQLESADAEGPPKLSR